ncbi:MAG: bifunctional N(6)-L-threonylcarbamoyladenine synthase/serine/threonine protein kinase [Salinirussus sp.]
MDVDRVLGIEGTAWAASAAVFDVPEDDVTIYTEAYEPDSGGIHPREAAEHMAECLPAIVEQALEGAGDIDAVAFSRGPGLGPCLRIAATAARSVAQRRGIPLIGVNHMVAHLEIGRHRSGFEDPLCLNASGANAHVLAYRNNRYRVLGETMDTGVGNAIDKFTRHLGWSHPGGPKVEQRAREGEYVDLPYVVKGMDFSFAGLSSAAKAAVDDGVPVADVCRGLEETVFAMLTEVSERALSLTGAERLVVGGGVGQNDRLQNMLRSMCNQRDAVCYVPEDRFLRDNAGMIAVLGAKMARVDDTLPIAESTIDADFRPDEVPVTWRADPGQMPPDSSSQDAVQGAEATVTIGNTVEKRRSPREYRHPALDQRLRRERTRKEARLLHDARIEGVPTPVLHDVDPHEGRLVMERVGVSELRDELDPSRIGDVVRHLADLHHAGIVHGDPTTRNIRVGPERTYLIDFGLGYTSHDAEDHAMDLHVLRQSLAGTATAADDLLPMIIETYREAGETTVIDRLTEIEGRGRYR